MLKLTKLQLAEAGDLCDRIRHLTYIIDRLGKPGVWPTWNAGPGLSLRIPDSYAMEMARTALAQSHAALAVLGVEFAPDEPEPMSGCAVTVDAAKHPLMNSVHDPRVAHVYTEPGVQAVEMKVDDTLGKTVTRTEFHCEPGVSSEGVLKAMEATREQIQEDIRRNLLRVR